MNQGEIKKEEIQEEPVELEREELKEEIKEKSRIII